LISLKGQVVFVASFSATATVSDLKSTKITRFAVPRRTFWKTPYEKYTSEARNVGAEPPKTLVDGRGPPDAPEIEAVEAAIESRVRLSPPEQEFASDLSSSPE
jgi:hypothetical protein